MRKFILLLTVIFINLSNLNAEIKNIAVVDIDKIIEESDVMQDIKRQIEERRKKFHEEISAQETNFVKEREELAKQEQKISPEAFDQKVKSFDTKIAETKRSLQIKRMNIEEAFNEAVLEVSKIAGQIIENYAKEKKFSLVHPTTQILYADSEMDVTSEIAKRLNNKIKKLTIKKSGDKK